ncbi:MAG: hypothetical protein EB084_06665 [Proteobacteria bacterium]|nr:hypothetical protein [Pseudomonadota bacterium]
MSSASFVRRPCLLLLALLTFCGALPAAAAPAPSGTPLPSPSASPSPPRPSPSPVHATKASSAPDSVSWAGTFLKTLSRVPEPGADWHPLRDRFGRYALAVPADWVEGTLPEDTQGLLYSLVAGEAQPRDGFNANMVVSQTQVPKSYTLKAAMAADMAKRMTAEMKPYKYAVKDRAFTRIDGLPCIIIGGTLEVDGRPLRNLQLRIAHREVSYLFTFTALEKTYAQFEPLFARVVRAIAFERETPEPRASGAPGKP